MQFLPFYIQVCTFIISSDLGMGMNRKFKLWNQYARKNSGRQTSGIKTERNPVNRALSWTIISIKCCLILLAVVYQFTFTESELTRLFSTNELVETDLILIISSIIYAILLAIPYFPGIEVGFVIMIIFGGKGVISVYIATTIGLLAAFLLGNNMRKNSRVTNRFSQILISEITQKIANFSPMLALMILLNLPGNIVLGGGGGIAMSYGYYRKLSTFRFIISLLIATSPIPILIGILGVARPL